MIAPEDMTPDKLRQIAEALERIASYLMEHGEAPGTEMQETLRRWADEMEFPILTLTVHQEDGCPLCLAQNLQRQQFRVDL